MGKVRAALSLVEAEIDPSASGQGGGEGNCNESSCPSSVTLQSPSLSGYPREVVGNDVFPTPEEAEKTAQLILDRLDE